MKCEVCGADPSKQRVIIHRVNPKGELPARFRCLSCMTSDQINQIDPEVREITEIIRGSNEPLDG